VRLLSLAVAALVLADPLLVHSVGFLLSVAATAAIVVAARPLAAAVPGPGWLRVGASVTLTAELGIAPVAVIVFGGVPVAALPANLLAVPAAGLVVVWGLPLGLAGSALRAVGVPGGAWLARVLLLPASLLLRWVAAVARWSAGLPLGELHTRELLVLAAAAVVLIVGARRAWPVVRRIGLGLALVALALPAITLRAGVPLHTTLSEGLGLWRAGGATVVVLTGPVSPVHALADLSSAGVRRVDLVVAGTGGARDAAVVEALRHRWAVREALAPTADRIRHVDVPRIDDRLQIGGLVITVTSVEPHLRVRISVPAGEAPEGPV
jgi:competence protein ComEC